MSDERLTITAEPRTVVGKKVKQLRRSGMIPAVIYGQQDSVKIQLENLSLRRLLRQAGSTHLVDISLGQSKRTVLVREVQSHVTRGDLLHVDFIEVDMKSTITAEAELVAVGQSAPAAEGLGVATLALRLVEIESLPDHLVSEIEVDFTKIKTPDDVIYVSDLVAPEGVTILTDPETTVARFEYTQAAGEEEEEEDLFVPAADAVEVVGRGKDEDDFEE
ncbi:MAG: 50S ribosomal protein L25 [Ardenticatenaceae bacterium]|nr:50S ribosomal protein L25 [Ardenticatenaceae bacterium]MCB9443563.1 50S ribosomal protein L25 [Ardenticatenaceae bacterium]